MALAFEPAPFFVFFIATYLYVILLIYKQFVPLDFKRGGSMLVHIFIEINGKINSHELYENLINLGDVNVTDLGDQVLVYGDIYLAQASQVVYNCALYGNIEVAITH